jgi:transglutaminase-like putative cysteine protease
MYYSIRHVTRFRYSSPVTESIMEVRMQPRTESPQRCLSFSLSVAPRTRVLSYQDYLGNSVHHFDVPQPHSKLAITAEALVEVQGTADLPEALASTDWEEADRMGTSDAYELLQPSHFAQPSERLNEFKKELGVDRRRDPLTLAREVNGAVFEAFAYVPKSTKVDSPIDEALERRHGVCQDFAHIYIALMREAGIPARYVSGYLYHRAGVADRSSEGATHAWAEVLLPHLGWVGFDPTNNLIAGERHIRTAIGRDYADVPPTRGVFKGAADSALSVSVRVAPSDAPAEEQVEESEDWNAMTAAAESDPAQEAQQQQQ